MKSIRYYRTTKTNPLGRLLSEIYEKLAFGRRQIEVLGDGFTVLAAVPPGDVGKLLDVASPEKVTATLIVY